MIVFPTCAVDSSWASWPRCRTACPVRLQASQDPRDYCGYWCLSNGWCLDEHTITKLNAPCGIQVRSDEPFRFRLSMDQRSSSEISLALLTVIDCYCLYTGSLLGSFCPLIRSKRCIPHCLELIPVR